MIYGSAKEWLNGLKNDWKSGKRVIPIIEIIISFFIVLAFIIGVINGFKSLIPTNEEPIVIYSDSGSMLNKQKSESEKFTYEQIYTSFSNPHLKKLYLKYEPVPNSLSLTWGKVGLPLDSFSIEGNALIIFEDKIPKDYSSQPYTWDDLRVTYRKIIK